MCLANTRLASSADLVGQFRAAHAAGVSSAIRPTGKSPDPGSTDRFTISEKVQWQNQEDAIIHTSEEVVTIALTLFKHAIALRLEDT
jgi:hypothetical protein